MRIACALACALLSAAPAFGEQAGTEPLGLRIQGTLRELFLDTIATDARPAGRPSINLRYSIANDWGMPTSYARHQALVRQQLDEQSDSLTVAARLPWSALLGRGAIWDDLSTTLEARATLHWGGWSDAPIERWHDLTGAFNFNRDSYPRNAIDLTLLQSDGTSAFDIHSARLALGDLVTRTQLTLWQGGFSSGPLLPGGELRPARALALRLDLKAPTGQLSRLGGSGGWDAGLVLLGTAELTYWLTGHALAGISAFSGWSTPLLLQPKTWHATAEVSLVASLGDFAFLLEDRVRSPLLLPGWERLEDGGNDGYLSSTLAGAFRSHNQVSWGIRYRRLSIWLSEDFTPGSNPRGNLMWLYNSNHPDVVIGVAYQLPL